MKHLLRNKTRKKDKYSKDYVEYDEYDDDEFDDDEFDDDEFDDDELSDDEFDNDEFDDDELSDDEFDDDKQEDSKSSYLNTESDHVLERKDIITKRTEKPVVKRKNIFSGFGMMEGMIAVTGVIILAIAVVVFTRVQILKSDSSVETLGSAGDSLISMESLGNDGILAVSQAASLKLQQQLQDAADALVEEDTKEDEVISATLNYTSIEKDIKIKFVNNKSGKLLASTEFMVEMTSSKGKTVTYTDDDKDGIIYKSGLTAGTYTIKVLEAEGYSFSKDEYTVVVKDTIEYVKVDVSDEIKKEEEIDVAVEDTAEEVEQEEVLADTVEWVDSTKTASSNPDGYKTVDKSTIVDPATLLAVGKLNLSGYMLMAQLSNDYVTSISVSTSLGESGTVNTGESLTLVANVTAVGENVSTQVTWTSADDTLVTVSNQGVIHAVGSVTTDTNVVITATTMGLAQDGVSTLTGTFTVTLKAPVPVTVYASTLTLDKTTATTSMGTSLSLIATLTKTDSSTETSATEGVVTWSSSDTKIATVDSKGIITPVKAGSVTITATSTPAASDGKYPEVSCTVTISNSGLTLTMVSTQKAYIGVKLNIPVTMVLNGVSTVINGTDATKGLVTWSGSADTVATVNTTTGEITPLTKGSFVLTATSVDTDDKGNQVKVSCTVTVYSDPALDTTTLLKDTSGTQIYVVKNGTYTAATSADYYTASAFYVQAATTYKYTGWQTIDGKTYYYDKNGNYVTGSQVILGMQYNFGSDGVLNLGNAILGIDVSKWNGTINWNAVKESGVNYVIIRVGFRGSSSGALVEDLNFKTNIAGATKAGIKVGVYFFSQAITEAEAVEEASMVLGLIKSYKISYPVFIDTEPSGGRADSLTTSQRTAVVKAFCETVKNAGYTPGVYASKYYYLNKLTASSLSSYKIWVAQYASTCTYTGKYDLWQFSSKGSINGISGDVDLNYSYMGY